METKVSSPSKEVIIGDNQPTVLIGERINPTGREKLTEALKVGDLEIVRKEALAQTQAGADIIDVNVGVFGIDEAALLPKAVQAIMETVDTPLCFDSSNHDALEAALKVYKGKPLVNSVTGEEHSLKRVLPMVKEYGAAVIGMVQDDNGIPKDADGRVRVLLHSIAFGNLKLIAPEKRTPSSTAADLAERHITDACLKPGLFSMHQADCRNDLVRAGSQQSEHLHEIGSVTGLAENT